MKISARNILSGTVRRIEPGSVNDEVAVTLAGGDELVAVVTHGSVVRLGLAAGKAVVALVKASSVLVLVDDHGLRLSARNRLVGTVSEVVEGAVNAEIGIALKGGDRIHAIITMDSVRTLGLKAGVPASAVIKASSVILGVRD